MKRLALIAALTLVFPLAALSGLSPGDEPTSARAPALDTAAAATRPTGERPRLMLRCWQFGRLLFEDTVSSIPEAAVRYRMENSTSASVYLLETKNGLCFVRPYPAGERAN